MMEWPINDPEHPNKFVTTPTNQEIWLRVASAALQRADHGENDKEWKNRLEQWQTKMRTCKSRQWRFAYRELIGELVQIMSDVQPPPQVMVEMCEAGLNAAHELMVVRMEDDKTVSARQAFEDDAIVAEMLKPLQTDTFHGSLTAESNTKDDNPWSNGTISPAQLETWATYGCMEESAAKHASQILGDTNNLNETLTQFAHDKIFVLLGATSEMGPTSWLMKIPGAHLLAIARPGTKLQQLVAQFQATAHTSTTLQVPTIQVVDPSSDGGATRDAGADMLQYGPQIARWIIQLANERAVDGRKTTSIVLCSLAYLDGEAHVRVSVAMDLIVQYVIQHWTAGTTTTTTTPSSNQVILWYLTSPSTVLAIPPHAAQRARERYQERPTWQRILQSMSLGSWLQPTKIWEQHHQQQQQQEKTHDIESNHSSSLHILNNLVTLQGPNYALAKTLQQWRCMVEDWRTSYCNADDPNQSKVLVIAPCAPPTRTQNMVSHPQVATSLDGLDYFPPLMAFQVQEASLLVTAILISLTQQQQQQQQHKNQDPSVSHHPMTIFWEGSVHGGYWESPYQSDSAGVVTYLLGATLAKFK